MHIPECLGMLSNWWVNNHWLFFLGMRRSLALEVPPDPLCFVLFPESFLHLQLLLPTEKSSVRLFITCLIVFVCMALSNGNTQYGSPSGSPLLSCCEFSCPVPNTRESSELKRNTCSQPQTWCSMRCYVTLLLNPFLY